MPVSAHDRSLRAAVRTGLGRVALAVLGACGLALSLVPAAQAAVRTVTSTADSGAGSLRDTLTAANPGDTISIPTPGDYLVTSAQLTVAKDVSIEGSGPTVRIVGDGNNRVFNVTAGNVTLADLTVTGGGVSEALASGGGIANATGTLVLRGVTVTGNTVSWTSGGVPSGGGVFNASGTLEVLDSTISANTAAVTPGGGGVPQGAGIANSSGSVTIARSSITGNTASIAEPGGAPEGGGVESSGGTLTILDSTVSGNTARGGSIAEGGGIAAFETTTAISGTTVSGNVGFEQGGATISEGGAIQQFKKSLSLSNTTIAANSVSGEFSTGGGVDASETTVAATNVTIAGNVASGANGTGGNLVAIAKSTVKPENTIVAGGTAATGANCSVGPKAVIESQGHNLDSLDECAFKAAGDLANTDPLLSSLAGNGGPTQTMALAPGSPAIDAADAAACPATDQRGALRPAGGGCDIGAFELATPGATSGDAGDVGQTAATLNGLGANPDLAQATAFFQYGTTDAYGQTAPAQAIGPLTAQAAVAASVAGLAPGTTYHFRLVVQNGAGTAYGADRTFTTAAPPAVISPQAPRLTGVSQSRARWREGRKLASLARARKPGRGSRAPVGTTFSFTLDQQATVRFAFAQLVAGRKGAGGKCVAQTRRNRHKRRCERTVARGTLPLAGRAGASKLAFQGRLSSTKKLPPGRYRLVITATNPAGQRSRAAVLQFTIVR